MPEAQAHQEEALSDCSGWNAPLISVVHHHTGHAAVNDQILRIDKAGAAEKENGLHDIFRRTDAPGRMLKSVFRIQDAEQPRVNPARTDAVHTNAERERLMERA